MAQIDNNNHNLNGIRTLEDLRNYRDSLPGEDQQASYLAIQMMDEFGIKLTGDSATLYCRNRRNRFGQLLEQAGSGRRKRSIAISRAARAWDEFLDVLRDESRVLRADRSYRPDAERVIITRVIEYLEHMEYLRNIHGYKNTEVGCWSPSWYRYVFSPEQDFASFDGWKPDVQTDAVFRWIVSHQRVFNHVLHDSLLNRGSSNAPPTLVTLQSDLEQKLQLDGVMEGRRKFHQRPLSYWQSLQEGFLVRDDPPWC